MVRIRFGSIDWLRRFVHIYLASLSENELPEPQEMLIVEDPNNKRNNAKDDADSMGDVEKQSFKLLKGFVHVQNVV